MRRDLGIVEKKNKAIRATESKASIGDQYTYVALDPKTKLVITFRVGKRDIPNTSEFIRDLSERVISDVQISTDSFGAYRGAMRRAFGPEISYGQQVKVHDRKSDGRNSAPEVIAVIRTPISGTPIEAKISTCLVERGNLNMRTFMRRLTRLCLGVFQET
jgi:IS1 family transposase